MTGSPRWASAHMQANQSYAPAAAVVAAAAAIAAGATAAA
eukprot:CAMPEP_0183480716 /NCGR_PEP_ID=MMETSP0370-20130417/173752_1 /TAXON_ID=268820 /ORGANISM="Peridinium aciculiferum, Strain PAER-2" /LENGTH=39 /DNA_ID= /DNA_START= /DNA_END= /DNA_ORIENTATION=